MLTLYVKIHNDTGLLYLGKTSAKDPSKYRGSGVYWKDHLRIHGNNTDTVVLLETEDKDELKFWGSFYSDLWDIVVSKDENGNKIWANLKPEHGDGGWESANTPEVTARRLSTWRKKYSGDNNPMRQDDVIAKITGDNHPRRKNPEKYEKLSGEYHWTKREGTTYTTDKNPMKRPEVASKLAASISGDNHYSRQPGYTAEKHPMKKEEHRKRQSIQVSGDNNPNRREDLKVICEHCFIKTTKSGYTRAHGDKCWAKDSGLPKEMIDMISERKLARRSR